MKQIQIEETPLEIRIDGILQTPSTAEVIGSAVLEGLQTVGQGIATGIGNLVINLREELDLAVTDKIHGTHMRDSKWDKWEQERIARKAGQYGIRL